MTAARTTVDLPVVEPAPEPEPSSPAPPTVPAPRLGQAPAVLLLSSIGVVLVALAYQRGRTGDHGGDATANGLYWAGQVLVFTPVAARLLARRLAGAGEAFLLVLGLAVNQYLLKFLYSPDQLKFPDELQHWAATSTVLDTGALFQPNPALPVAESFPGLAEMGAGVASLTGLSVTASALLVAGLARLVFVGALFGLVRRAGGSYRLAGMTCVIYATGQHYLFFDAMYLYQTAALPFLALAIWAACAVRRSFSVGAGVVGAISIAVVTISHHLAAITMAGMLVILAGTDLFAARGRGRPAAVPGGRAGGRAGGRRFSLRRLSFRRAGGWLTGGRRWGTVALAGFAVVLVGGWMAMPAREVVDYLGPPARRVLDSLTELFSAGDAADRGGPASPRWQLAVQAVCLLILLVLLLKAGRTARRTGTRDPWWWTVLAGGLGFFAGTLLWFAGPQGPELAGRAATFTFLPMSIVAAAELVRRRSGAAYRHARRSGTRRRSGLGLVAGTAIATLLMVGARAGGWPPWWERLPGPHLVGAFESSIDQQGVAAAGWTGGWLGSGRRIAADATGWILLASYGQQAPIAGQAAPAYYSSEFGLADAQLLDRLSVEYLWVDLRMSERTPATGSYFSNDPLAGRHIAPVPRGRLTKFGELPGVDLIYDSGDLRIYDVRDL